MKNPKMGNRKQCAWLTREMGALNRRAFQVDHFEVGAEVLGLESSQVELLSFWVTLNENWRPAEESEDQFKESMSQIRFPKSKGLVFKSRFSLTFAFYFVTS